MDFRAHTLILKDQVEKMIKFELYESAEKLLNLYISAIPNSKTSDEESFNLIIQSEMLELYADAIFEQENYRRSLNYYVQALLLRKHANPKKARPSNLIQTTDEARIRFKECKCHIKLKDSPTALRELEIIPTRLRNPAINSYLGKLYKASNLNKQAIAVYKDILKEIPTSVEAIEALASLGESSNEITSMLVDSYRDKPVENLFDNGWLHDLVNALVNKRLCEYEKVEKKVKHLLTVFPKSTYLLTQMGSAAIDAEKYEDAFVMYKQIRRLDSLIIDGMDKFGYLLFQLGDATELNLLAHDVLNSSTATPMGWIIVALFCEIQGQADKAMGFLEKATQIDPKYAWTYIIKGKLFLSQGHAKQSTVAFYQANNITKDLISLSGIIDAHLEMNRFQDALSTAKEALITMPRSSAAFFIMGKVLCKVPGTNGVNEGLKAFTKALKLNPSNKQAASHMAEMLCSQNKFKEAIECLKDVLSQVSCSRLRTQLAKIYASIDEFYKALNELHTAISLNPQNCEESTQELNRIESLLRGDTSGHPDDCDDDDASPAASNHKNNNNNNNISSVSIHSISHSISHSHSHSQSLFSDDDNSGIDRALFADDGFASDSD